MKWFSPRSTLAAALLVAAAVALPLGSGAHADTSGGFASNDYTPPEYAHDPFNPIIARDAWLLIGRTEQAYNIPLGLLHAIALAETGQGIRGWMMPWPYTIGVNSTGAKQYPGAATAIGGLNWMRGIGFVRYDVRAGSAGLSKATTAQAMAFIQAHPSESFYRLEPYPFGRRFNSADDAQTYAMSRFAMGHNNLDIGMMQINWRAHGKNFGSVREALDPQTNVKYAVTYLLNNQSSPAAGRVAGPTWWGSVGRYHSATPRFAKQYILSVWNMYQRIHRLKA